MAILGHYFVCLAHGANVVTAFGLFCALPIFPVRRMINPVPVFQQIAEQIAQVLDEARQEVLVAVAWLTDPQLTRSLAQCAAKGCRVVVIIHDDAINAQYCPVEWLREQGVRVLLYPQQDAYSSMMHHKFCVTDQRTTITGSYNWTVKANRNEENIIILREDSETARMFKQTFEALADELGMCMQTGLTFSPLYAHYRRQIGLLETEIAVLLTETEQFEQLIRRFELAYWAALGHLLRQEALYKAQIAELYARRVRKSAARAAAEEARHQYEQYHARAEAAQPPLPEPAPEASRTLQQLLRKIARIAHPDRYAQDPAKFERANRLMAEANAAYAAQDIAALQDLLARLENGLDAADQLPDDLDRLAQLYASLLARRDALILALVELRSSERGQKAMLSDYGPFLAAEETRLRAIIRLLAEELEKLEKTAASGV